MTCLLSLTLRPRERFSLYREEVQSTSAWETQRSGEPSLPRLRGETRKVQSPRPCPPPLLSHLGPGLYPRGPPRLGAAGAQVHCNGHTRRQDTSFFSVKKTAVFDLHLTRFTKRGRGGPGLLAPPSSGQCLQDSLSDRPRPGPPGLLGPFWPPGPQRLTSSLTSEVGPRHRAHPECGCPTGQARPGRHLVALGAAGTQTPPKRPNPGIWAAAGAQGSGLGFCF